MDWRILAWAITENMRIVLTDKERHESIIPLESLIRWKHWLNEIIDQMRLLEGINRIEPIVLTNQTDELVRSDGNINQMESSLDWIIDRTKSLSDEIIERMSIERMSINWTDRIGWNQSINMIWQLSLCYNLSILSIQMKRPYVSQYFGHNNWYTRMPWHSHQEATGTLKVGPSK